MDYNPCSSRSRRRELSAEAISSNAPMTAIGTPNAMKTMVKQSSKPPISSNHPRIFNTEHLHFAGTGV